jgi:hypothetical protein
MFAVEPRLRLAAEHGDDENLRRDRRFIRRDRPGEGGDERGGEDDEARDHGGFLCFQVFLWAKAGSGGAQS